MEAVNSSSIRAKVIGRFDFHHNSRNLQELQIAFPNIWTQMEESLSRQIVAFNGRDKEGMSIINIYGCYLPSVKHVDYQLLLEHCLVRLEPCIRDTYVIVFFARPMEHTPTIFWLHSAYKSIKARFRKNIKKFYIVHPSCWVRMAVWTMRNILSDNFSKKIRFIETIEQLETLISLQNISIPPAITGFDRGYPSLNVDDYSGNLNKTNYDLPSIKLFGADIERSQPEGNIPEPIMNVVHFLEKSGMVQVGIFRMSPDPIQIEQIRMSMDRGYDIDLSIFSVHSVAAAFKAYFRQLPTPIIPTTVYKYIPKVNGLAEDDRASYIKKNVFCEISQQRLRLLALVMRLLRLVITNGKKNRMSLSNLATIWTPNLMRRDTPEEELRHLLASQRFVEILILERDNLFSSFIEYTDSKSGILGDT